MNIDQIENGILAVRCPGPNRLADARNHYRATLRFGRVGQGGGGGGKLSINWMIEIPRLVQALKELNSKVDSQNATILGLTNRLNTLVKNNNLK